MGKYKMRSVFIAYVLWFFFGGLGVHRFYLRKSSAVGMLVVFVVGWLLVGIAFFGIASGYNTAHEIQYSQSQQQTSSSSSQGISTATSSSQQASSVSQSGQATSQQQVKPKTVNTSLYVALAIMGGAFVVFHGAWVLLDLFNIPRLVDDYNENIYSKYGDNY